MSDQRNMFYGASPSIFEKAKMLRLNMTKHEKILWEELRSNKINGLRFKPQHPMAHFVVDFYCHKIKLVIEIDGKNHCFKDQIDYDAKRTDILEEFGIMVLRLNNEQIENNVKLVVETIKEECNLQLIKLTTRKNEI